MQESTDNGAEGQAIEHETLERALDTWGLDAQIDQTEEELAELLVALKGNNVAAVIEELADVRIMVEQLTLEFGEENVQRVIDQKMERLEYRIDSAQTDDEELVTDGGEEVGRAIARSSDGTGQLPPEQDIIDRIAALEETARELFESGLNTESKQVSEAADRLRAHVRDEYGKTVSDYPFTSDDLRNAGKLAESTSHLGAVSRLLCEKIRHRRHAGEKPIEIANALPVSNSVVHTHATGDCHHDIDVEPTGQCASRITAKTCRELRTRRAGGERLNDILEDMHPELAEYTASRHSAGECPHEIDAEPVKTSVVPSDACSDWRESVRGGASVYAVAEESRFAYETVRVHVVGDCDHDCRESPLAYDGSQWVSAGGSVA